MEMESCFTHICDDNKTLRHSELVKLSGISKTEFGEFQNAWTNLSSSRKSEVLGKLHAMTEDNLEFDFNVIFQTSLTDISDDVREMAITGLWEFEDRSIIRPLITILRDDSSSNVRARAAASMEKFALMAQESKLTLRDSERVKQALLDAISNENNVEVRRRAIESVASFDVPEVEHFIWEAYESSEITLKQSALYAMGRSGNIQWMSTVLGDMQHKDSSIRYEAVNACAQLGDESAVPLLISLTKDDDFQVQVCAVEALGTVGGPMAKQALQQCLRMEDESLEEAIQLAMNLVEFDEDPLGFRFPV